MTTGIEWAEPPAPSHPGPGYSKWQAIGEELRKNPGRWALVAREISASMVTQIRQGRTSLGPGQYEVTSRTNGYARSKVDIYARYVGEVSS